MFHKTSVFVYDIIILKRGWRHQITYEELRDEVLKLSASQRFQLFEDVIDGKGASQGDDAPLSDEEIIALVAAVGSSPLTGAQMIAQGVLGGWEDLGIADGRHRA